MYLFASMTGNLTLYAQHTIATVIIISATEISLISAMMLKINLKDALSPVTK